MYVELCAYGTLHKKPAVLERGEGDRKPEKPGRHSSEGGEVASRLTDNEIVLPRRTGYIPQMRDLSRFLKQRERGPRPHYPPPIASGRLSAGYPSIDAAWPQPANFRESIKKLSEKGY